MSLSYSLPLCVCFQVTRVCLVCPVVKVCPDSLVLLSRLKASRDSLGFPGDQEVQDSPDRKAKLESWDSPAHLDKGWDETQALRNWNVQQVQPVRFKFWWLLSGRWRRARFAWQPWRIWSAWSQRWFKIWGRTKKWKNKIKSCIHKSLYLLLRSTRRNICLSRSSRSQRPARCSRLPR